MTMKANDYEGPMTMKRAQREGTKKYPTKKYHLAGKVLIIPLAQQRRIDKVLVPYICKNS
jgi:hypothetical protein